MSSWDTNPWSNFFYSHWELICPNKWHPATSEISAPPEIAVGTQFNVGTFWLSYESEFVMFFVESSPAKTAVAHPVW